MLTKRVIPCLDVHDGKVTRGVQFGRAESGGLRNVGDPVALALRYNEQGADEMVFFDITASAHGRATMVSVIERTADECFMPLTVGGGIRTVEDMHAMLKAGADKVSINSSAILQRDAELEVEGEMRADSALFEPLRERLFPNSRLKGKANLMIMPSLDAANILLTQQPNVKHWLVCGSNDNLVLGPGSHDEGAKGVVGDAHILGDRRP